MFLSCSARMDQNLRLPMLSLLHSFKSIRAFWPNFKKMLNRVSCMLLFSVFLFLGCSQAEGIYESENGVFVRSFEFKQGLVVVRGGFHEGEQRILWIDDYEQKYRTLYIKSGPQTIVFNVGYDFIIGRHGVFNGVIYTKR